MSVEPQRLTGIYLNLPLGVVALVFLCRAGHGEPFSETDEAIAVEWLTPDEIARRSVPAFAMRVSDALAGYREPVLRHHDGVRLLGVDGDQALAGGDQAAEPAGRAVTGEW